MKRQIEIEIQPTPKELAELFCEMNSDGHVEFFNEIANCVKEWNQNFCFQLQFISDSGKLTNDARIIMQQIGEYSK